MVVAPTVIRRVEDGVPLSMLWWQAPQRLRAVSTAMVGGGLGARGWFLNAQVPADYQRTDPDVDLRRLARSVGLRGRGVAMMTAVDVSTVVRHVEEGVTVLATVGLGWPTWAAPRPGVPDGWAPAAGTEPRAEHGPAGSVGTINLFVVVDASLDDAALVNLLATATEAKTQALMEAGVPGTGTASDALCVACQPPRAPVPRPQLHDGSQRFGGPRSTWGLRVARAVHRAVTEGARDDHQRALAGGWPRGAR
ncbi:MAG: adenosylcobinamide amidohydrolase [Acidimicrobiales bacterium]